MPVESLYCIGYFKQQVADLKNEGHSEIVTLVL